MKQCLALAILAITCLGARAAEWASSQVLSNNTRVYAVVPAGATVSSLVGHVFASTGGSLILYQAGSPATVSTNAMAAGATIIMTSTNGLAPEDLILIQATNELFQFTQINAVVTGLIHLTNSVNAAPAVTEFPLYVGAKIYPLTKIGGHQLTSGAGLSATLAANGGTVYLPPNSRPGVIEVRATGTVTNCLVIAGGTRW